MKMKAKAESWLPNLAARSRHLAKIGNKKECAALQARLTGEGAEIVYASEKQVYFEMKLEHLLLSEAFRADDFDGGKYNYIAHRLLSYQVGHSYSTDDVPRVAQEVEKLQSLLTEEPEVSKKTPVRKSNKRGAVK